MSIPQFCPPCWNGHHERHIPGAPVPGLIGGTYCPCPGNCVPAAVPAILKASEDQPRREGETHEEGTGRSGRRGDVPLVVGDRAGLPVHRGQLSESGDLVPDGLVSRLQQAVSDEIRRTAFDPGSPIMSGDLIEDEDGAPLPHELQPGGRIWEAVQGSVGMTGYYQTDVEAIMRALAPILWPLLPSNDHRDVAALKISDDQVRAALTYIQSLPEDFPDFVIEWPPGHPAHTPISQEVRDRVDAGNMAHMRAAIEAALAVHADPEPEPEPEPEPQRCPHGETGPHGLLGQAWSDFTECPGP